MQRALIWRLAAAVTFLAIAHVAAQRALELRTEMWLVQLGERLGAEVPRVSGLLMMGPRGPFQGESAAFWNALYRNVPWTLTACVALGAGCGAYWVVSVPLGRYWVFRHQGPTRCGGCGYGLEGLARPLCPECGRSL